MSRVSAATAVPVPDPAVPIVEVRDLETGYGPYRALFGVSFTVAHDTAVAVLGPNGSGKSTVARAVTGLLPVSRGSIHLDGRDVTGLPAWKLVRLGIAHAPEGRSVFASLTVEENLTLSFRRALGRKAVPEALERAFGAFPWMGQRRKQEAGTLSGGEQRMLSLSRVIANPPRLLVVDELSHGLAPKMVDQVFAVLRDVKESGTSLLVVEQHVGRALELADEAVLVLKGQVIHQGPVADLGDRVDQLLPDTTR